MNEYGTTLADTFDKRSIAELMDKVKMWQLQKKQRAENERKKQLTKHGNQNGSVHRT